MTVVSLVVELEAGVGDELELEVGLIAPTKEVVQAILATSRTLTSE